MPFHIVLYQPEIPPNTGNVQRLCANMGAKLHLIRPLGFQLEDRTRRRATMDYAALQKPIVHDSYEKFKDKFSEFYDKKQVFALTTRGQERYDNIGFSRDSILLFGPETRGLPEDVLSEIPSHNQLYLPMQQGSRSLNLSNAVAITAYEAWRQLDFFS